MLEKRKRLPAGKMKENIIKVATDLLIRHGLRGTSYEMIAKKLKITTTNIHYHFGSKKVLVTAVIEHYVDDATSKHSDIWLSKDMTLFEKVSAVKEFNRRRFSRYNTTEFGGRPWSLIGRMRLESDALPQRAANALEQFSRDLQQGIQRAVEQSVENGELICETPKSEVSQLLTGVVYSSAVFTQMTGGFSTLEKMYDAWWETIRRAYGASQDDRTERNVSRRRFSDCGGR